MATLVCDLDGTIFKWGTEDFLPGAAEALSAWVKRKNQIIFVTQREPDWRLEKELKRAFQKYDGQVHVLFDITSPRIVVNDQGVLAINHRKNGAFDYDLREAERMAECMAWREK